MVTTNLKTSRSWVEILNPFSISNSSDVDVEFWIGTVAPTASSVGHLLSKNSGGLMMDAFDDGDRLWVRSVWVKSSTGISSLLTVTSKS